MRWFSRFDPQGAAASLVLVAVLAVCAWAQVFSQYRLYDDEGYIIYTVRQFMDGLRIYDGFFTQYGPFYFLYTQFLLFVTGGIPSHDWTRMLTVFHWLGAVLFILLAARSTVAPWSGRLLAGLGAFFLLGGNASEPGHPGIAIAFLYAAFVWLVVTREQSRAGWFVAGAIIAVVGGMKVNSGVFLALAVAYGLLLARNLSPRWIAALLLAYPVLLIALVRERITEPGVLWFVVLVLLGYAGAVASGVIGAFSRTPRANRGVSLISCGFGAAVTALLLLLYMRVGDALTWRGLVDGVVVKPLELASAYRAPYLWTGWNYLTAGIAGISIGLCLLPAMRRRAWEHIPLAGATMIFLIALSERGWQLAWIGPLALETLVPCAWMVPALVMKRIGIEAARRETWVLILVLFAIWQAYPVPGSQISWALFPLSLLWARWVCLLVSELWRQLPSRYTRVREVYSGVLLLVLAFVPGAFSWYQYVGNVSLNLEGAQHIRLSRAQVADLRVMSNTARAHADVLFTYPGMLSLNVFSGVRPPGSHHVTHWYSLLDKERQVAIRNELEAVARPVVITSPAHISYLRRHNLLPEKNGLVAHLEEGYCGLFGTELLQFTVPCGREWIHPLGTFSRIDGRSSRHLWVTILQNHEWVEVRAIGSVDGERKAYSWFSGMFERRPGSAESYHWNPHVEAVVLPPPPHGRDSDAFHIQYIQFLDAEGREVDFAVPATRYFTGGGRRAGD